MVSEYDHINEHSHPFLRFNCYGFIGHLLQQVCPASYETITQFMYTNGDQVPISIDHKPCPFHYSAFFASIITFENKYWSSFQDFQDLVPGDLIVYLPKNFVPQQVEEIQSKRTGTHIMIVEQVLSKESDRIEIMIIDCTRLRHCEEDSRVKGGIGRSPLTIYAQSEGALIQWGTRKKKWSKDLFFGRLKDI